MNAMEVAVFTGAESTVRVEAPDLPLAIRREAQGQRFRPFRNE
jgi:hypothetical protein